MQPGDNLGEIRDLTERLDLAERRLAYRGDLLAAVLRALPLGISVCDADGVLMEFSDRGHLITAENGYGVRAEEWSEHFGCYRPDGTPWPWHELPLYRALQGEESSGQIMLLRPPENPDDQRTVLIRDAFPIRGEGGKIMGAVVTYEQVA